MTKIEVTAALIGALDERAMALAKARQETLTKPSESLGRLEEISILIAGITASAIPKVERKVIFTMAGDHGVVEEGVSAYPQEVTREMVRNFLAGGAAINVLARHVGATVVVVDMGVAADLEPHPELMVKKVGFGTKNFTRGPAMTREQAVESVEAGIEVFEQQLPRGIDIVGVGDMGIGNTTASSALAAALTGLPVSKVTGRGTGIDDVRYATKIAAIERALEINRPNAADALDVLAKVGGFEIGGLAGVILAAAAHRVPVVLDGFITGAAALVAAEYEPKVKRFLIAGHRSVEMGHRAILERLGLKPLLDLDLRLGEGTGAALALGIIEGVVRLLNEMATFEEARVSRANPEEGG